MSVERDESEFVQSEIYILCDMPTMIDIDVVSDAAEMMVQYLFWGVSSQAPI